MPWLKSPDGLVVSWTMWVRKGSLRSHGGAGGTAAGSGPVYLSCGGGGGGSCIGGTQGGSKQIKTQPRLGPPHPLPPPLFWKGRVIWMAGKGIIGNGLRNCWAAAAAACWASSAHWARGFHPIWGYLGVWMGGCATTGGR